MLRDPVSRKRFFRLMGGTGAAGALAVVVAACGDDEEEAGSGDTGSETGDADALAQFGEGDIGIANYALTLEYLEADFYSKAAESGMLKGAALELGKSFGEHEQAHVEALEKMIKDAGGTPADKPKTEFPLDSQDQILELAATVENLGAAAYLGQAANIESEDILAAALSIHTVEGRHAAALNKTIGKPITPDGAFAKPASAQEVLDEVQQFIKS
ncbi:MAG: ferritin-like domain-containing protein [Solirubrobacterales bacterium]